MKKNFVVYGVAIVGLILITDQVFAQRNALKVAVEKSLFIKNFENLELLYQDKPVLNLIKQNRQEASNSFQIVTNIKEHYTVEKNNFEKLKKEKPGFFLQEIKYNGKHVILSLEKTSLFTQDFFILTSDGQKIIPEDEPVFYRGIVKGSDQSIVTLSIFNHEFHYLISTNDGNFEIHSESDNSATGYFSHIKSNSTQDDHHSTESINHVPKRNHNSGLRSGNCIEIFMECDFYTHQALGNNITMTNAWVSNLFNNVAAVYASHQVPLVLRQIFVWTTSDPYSSATHVGQFRDQFVSYRQNNYNGKIAILLSNKMLGGGIANGIGGFCNTYPAYPGPQCVGSNLSLNNNGNGNFSYNTYLIAHELGHVMGLRHTHACVWGNNLVQIDDCGNVWASQNGQTVEGSTCYNGLNPILPATQGTIMSNCDLLNQVGINLSNGFGSVAGKVLFDQYVYAPCITGTSCNNLTPVNDLCNNAILLPVNHSCTNLQFSNQDATPSQNLGGLSCGNGGNPVRDVWFKVEVPPSGKVTLATSQVSGGLTDLIMEIYAGSCNNLSSIACNDNDGEGNHARITLSNRTPGEILLIRVVDHLSNQYGMFNICASDSLLPCHLDFAALVSFFNYTGGPSWTNKIGWQNGANGTDCNVCNWYGVQCNSLGRVSTINLPSNNITSTGLPGDLANLPYLTELRLYDNKISGNFPSVIYQLTKLNTLDLGRNLLTGNIPSSLSALTLLKSLYLDFNMFSGNLPASLSAINLSLLYVNNNSLSGCFPTSFSAFCNKAYNFTGNALLANGVAFDDFCSIGNGIDNDGDSYCRGGHDCDDTDPNIHPQGVEVCNLKDDNCNGLTDDIIAPVTNNWVGGSGNWDIASNWSLGIPSRCQNIVINGSALANITIPSGVTAQARSVTIASGRTLTISTGGILHINHGLNLTNSGSLINHGSVTINNILDQSLFGISNQGTIINNSTGVITISNSGNRSFSNNTGGIFTNSGVLTIDRNALNQPSTGLYNAGTITNNENINIRNITGMRIHITTGAIFTNQANGFLSIE